ncbi:MAG: alpha/beta hydrolase [Betaproteobacteria bacterium]|nr:alpha/beta hydrolase [Betaproteobacteria bacterium]MDE2002283.1 alpha/beta hydrolase [Betaproteobacteria bacterium]MDE2209818.1 alpha/beta hydrolase [Betaproteobacteria bacterium]
MAMTPEEVERGYDNRAAVPDHPYWLAQFASRSKAAIETLKPALDLRYGAGDKETLDLYLPATPAKGTFVFIHGGYWRTFDKADHAFVAPSFVTAGFAVAVVNYDLCPGVTIAIIVEQCRHALRWIERDGPRHGAVGPVVIAGHSAGAHLAAMMFATDWKAQGLARSPFAGGVALSGVFDLEPLVVTSVNADLRLDMEQARRMSPVHLEPRVDATLVVAVGADETSEFLRQSQLLHDAWPRNRPAGANAPLQLRDRNHYSVALDFADPAGELVRATMDLLTADPRSFTLPHK